MTGSLHLIGSPIGSHLDISLRLITAISSATIICVEDTERFKEFCKSHSMEYTAELIDILYSPGNDREQNVSDYIINKLLSGEDVHLISDEGMPGFADPGITIFNRAVENNINIISSPGPSTIIAAAAVAGIFDRFSFEGFLHFDDFERHSYWQYLKTIRHPMIFLLQNPKNIPKSTNEKVYATYKSCDTFFFLDEAITYLGNRKCMYAIDLTTSRQRIIRSTLIQLKETLSLNNYPGNACIVIY